MNILAAIFFIMIGLMVQFLTLGLGVFLLNILFKKNKLSDLEKLTCAYVLGITTTALFFFALLFTGLFYDGEVYAFGAIAIAVSLTQLNEIKKIAKGLTSFKNFKKISFFSKAGLVILFINLLVYFLINLTPVTAMDALHYHLDLIKRWHLAHAFIHPDYWYASIPFNVEMLFMWGQIFKSEIISGLFNFVFISSERFLFFLALLNLDLCSSLNFFPLLAKLILFFVTSFLGPPPLSYSSQNNTFSHPNLSK
jgi:hypothetical protein